MAPSPSQSLEPRDPVGPVPGTGQYSLCLTSGMRKDNLCGVDPVNAGVTCPAATTIPMNVDGAPGLSILKTDAHELFGVFSQRITK